MGGGGGALFRQYETGLCSVLISMEGVIGSLISDLIAEA